MKKFLLIEDSPIVAKIIKHVSKHNLELHCDTAPCFADAKKLISKHGPDFYLCAVVDLNLPDAQHGEVVDYTIEKHIPTIVLTGNYDEETRDRMLDKKIVDYIIKESRFSYEHIIKLIARLHKNQNIKILVADDSSTSRNHIKNLLETHLYQVITADDGDVALEKINQNPDIKLVITDYNMPRMNGFELVRNIRKEVSKNSLVIVGLSGEGDSKLSAKFIKNGANDFLTKPFSHEEFHCRIQHNIETMELLETMTHMAYHDYITGLPNKRKFFEDGSQQLEHAQDKNTHICLALMSVDNMPQLLDRYGLDAAEAILKNLADLLPKAFGRFSYARISDAEIAILIVGLTIEQAVKLLEGFREIVEDHIVMLDDLNFNFTISAGLVADHQNKLSELIKEADNRLYTAREEGGNQVCSDNDAG